MDQEDPQSEPQELDLSDSIDALLDEIDASCARFEKQPDPDPGSLGLISDDGTVSEPPPAPTTEPAENPEPGSEAQAESESESESASESVGDEALDALEAVTQSAEDLLEESIGELLDEQSPTAETPSIAEGSAEGRAESHPTDDPESAPPEALDEETMLDSINEDLVDALGDEQLESAHALDEDDAQPIDAGHMDAALTESVEAAEVTEIAEVAEVAEAIEDAAEALAEQPAPQAIGEEEEEEEEADQTDQASATQGPQTDDLLGNLDDALAGIGDELLMGDFEDADGTMIDSDALDDSIDPAMLLDQLDLPEITPADETAQSQTSTASSSPSDPAAPHLAESAQPISSASPTSEPTPEPTPEPTLDSGREVRAQVRVPEAIKATPGPASPAADVLDETEIESIWKKLWRTGKAHSMTALAIIKARGAPIAARGILAISKPLASKPAQVRDSIGYLAIWTMFLALVLWIYVMFFRTPPPIVPDHAPTRMVTPGENLEPIENQMTHPLPEQP